MSNDSNTININARMKAQEAGKAIKSIAWLLALIVIAIIVLSAATFTVNEHQQTVITRFGEIKKIVIDSDMYTGEYSIEGVKVVEGKGLFFKIPFIDKVEQYDSWLNTYVSDSEDVNTAFFSCTTPTTHLLPP